MNPLLRENTPFESFVFTLLWSPFCFTVFSVVSCIPYYNRKSAVHTNRHKLRQAQNSLMTYSVETSLKYVSTFRDKKCSLNHFFRIHHPFRMAQTPARHLKYELAIQTECRQGFLAVRKFGLTPFPVQIFLCT